ncbi:hypothetical protein ACFMPD_05425 [Sedimentitalea sp. HM32M-2]|uniref:hypothetical protein n=1 Tax=Sedimentitalea sp. HM32M-2 TaxID=3351566 RepID=UPI00363E60BD
MAKPVFIHAGAHRTGTSSLQLCLAENRSILSCAGFDLAYPGRDDVPGGTLRLPLPRPRHGEKRIPQFADRIRRKLDRLSPGADRGLILSEENIPGPMRHFYEGRFYPASAKRLRTLAAALPNPPRHVLFVVRSYDDLYVSAHRKRAEDNAVDRFSDLVPQFLAMDRGWPELLAEIRDLLRPEQLTVLPYERRGPSRQLLVRLLPQLGDTPLAEPAVAMNLSATDAALEALQARYRAGQTLARRQWRQVVQDHAAQAQPRGFATFSTADRERLRARYRADLARLAAMPGISLG